MVISSKTDRRIVAEDPNGAWEPVDGRRREKPAMTLWHNDARALLGHALMRSLDSSRFRVHCGGARLELIERNYFVPDLVVIPAESSMPLRAQVFASNFYASPLSLLVEIWPPPTDAWCVDEKIPLYKARGDKEIWRMRPYERTLTIGRRQPGETCSESFHKNGAFHPAFHPNVAIDLGRLFI